MKCIVGLSGGVDSSTSAAIMKEKGVEVIGCTFKMMESKNTASAIQDAQKVADFLKINHIVIDCVKDFKNYVIDYFIDSYKKGITPNPCVMCNKFIKFKHLENVRLQQNADLIVTGHYANLKKKNDRVELMQAVDLSRDQSYFLYRIDAEILRHVKFPLGDNSKTYTRELARKFGIHVAEKSDSQDVCFIPNGDYVGFIQNRSSELTESGDIVNEKGEILGKHDGIVNYTVGQRKGLGLAGGPFFVSALDAQKNRVIVSNKSGIGKKQILLRDVVFINEPYLGSCEVKIRSTTQKISAEIIQNSGNYFVELFQSEYGIAPGQHCVFYIENIVLGGGVIC
ncbi:MAG: tRNA 2-thiouridine(34) synthase MnmA [Holosporaceae bacterium]|nr:tRNA 2-thiouridine(34) synthase MnmA [Holosporaceae bacterium]